MKSKLIIGIIVSIVSAAFIVSFTGCQGGPAAVSEITLCKSIDSNYKPIEPTDVFEEGIQVVNLSLRVENITPSDKLSVAWNYLETGEELNTTEFTSSEKGSGYLGFNITIENGFPIGRFNAEVYLNDELIDTLEFSVE